MLNKIKILIIMISISFSLSMMSNTYSRYIASTTNSIETPFAKWQIMINNEDITSNNEASITFNPIIEKNENVKENTIAPSSKGYFDINIDPTNVDVSFSYKINLNIENDNMPDLLITKYAILDENYIEGDELSLINLDNNEINNSMIYNNSTFNKYTIRVFFEWYEGENELMNDQDDTNIGKDAVTNNNKLIINANIEFKQII